jgi:hypothetical protein
MKDFKTKNGFFTGNVGIGTTNPVSKLHVVGDGTNLGGLVMAAGAGIDSFRLYVDSNNKAHITRGASEKMTILSNGNVGIGTTNPGGKLDVSNGDIMISDQTHGATRKIYFDQKNSGGGSTDFSISSTNGSIDFRSEAQGKSYLYLQAGGNVGIGTASPNIYGLGIGRIVTSYSSSGDLYGIFGAVGSGTGGGEIDFGNHTVRHAAIASLDGSALAFYTNGSDSGSGVSERMRIDSNGNVGIGTDSPSSDISGSATVLEIEDSNIASLALNHGTTGKFEVAASSLGLYFGHSGDSKMVIQPGGNVGIGTTNPGTYKLAVSGSQTEFIQMIKNDHTSSAYGLYLTMTTNHDNTTSEFIRCASGGNIKFRVYSDGTILADGSAFGSDDRIKHNEEKIVNAVETLSKITPKKYFKTTKLYEANHDFDLDSHGNPIDENGDPVNHRVEAGVIAQEVLGVDELKFAVSPETKNEDGDVVTPYALNYNSLFTYAIAAIQEQQAIIEDLKARIETLES